MAVYTPLSLEEATRITEAHGLGPCTEITPIAAGSVNSNFFLHGAFGERFLRIYEEQERDGVAYEWSLLDHLSAGGIPVPERVRGTEPGEIRVEGKPTALFELVGGSDLCQAAIDTAHAAAAGRILARAHIAQRGFQWRREGRFRPSDLDGYLDEAAEVGRGDLERPIARLRQILKELEGEGSEDLPSGVIHGDMFRDNVHFEGGDIVAVIDWESASDGLFVYDLMVTVLAWCYGDRFDWELARALVCAYDEERPLEDAEWRALRRQGLLASTRFAVTRIKDFELRETVGDRIKKDYRRFLSRLEELAAFDREALARRLGEEQGDAKG